MKIIVTPLRPCIKPKKMKIENLISQKNLIPKASSYLANDKLNFKA